MRNKDLPRLLLIVTLLAIVGVVVWRIVYVGDSPVFSGNTEDVTASQSANDAPVNSFRGGNTGTPSNSASESLPTGRPTAAELRKRFEAATGRLDNAKQGINGLGGKLPDVDAGGPGADEIKRKFEENIRRYHERVTSPEYQNSKNNARWLRWLRSLGTESEEAFAQFPPSPDDLEYLNEEALRSEFATSYLGAFDTYFESKPSDDGEGYQLFSLLVGIATRAGYELGDEAVFIKWVKKSLKWGSAYFPVHGLSLSYGTNSMALPLNPSREIGLWSTPDEMSERFAAWGGKNLNEVRFRVLMSLAITASVDLGCDAMRGAALGLARSIPGTVAAWDKKQRAVGAMLITHLLPDLAAVILAGTDDASFGESVTVLQEATVAVVLAVKEEGKKQAYEDEFLANIREIRMLATKSAIREGGFVVGTDDDLDAEDEPSRDVESPSLSDEEFQKISQLGADWRDAGLLRPSLRWIANPPLSSLPADTKPLSLLLDGGKFTDELKSELIRLGAHAVPAILEILTELKGNDRSSNIVDTVIRAYEVLDRENQWREKTALLTSADHRQVRLGIAAYITRLTHRQYSDRKAGMPSLVTTSIAVSGSLVMDRHFTTLAAYDKGEALASALVGLMLLDGAGPSAFVGDVSGELGWQSDENQPRTLVCTRDVSLAKQFLKASVSLHGKLWTEGGAYLGTLVGRLAGIRVSADEDRKNPKVWLKLLNVEPDFHMFD